VPCNSLISVRRNAALLSLVLLAFIVLLLAEGYGQAAQRNVIRRVLPEYPALLKSKGIGGIVRCAVTVNPSGSVAKIENLGGQPDLGRCCGKRAETMEVRAKLIRNERGCFFQI